MPVAPTHQSGSVRAPKRIGSLKTLTDALRAWKKSGPAVDAEGVTIHSHLLRSKSRIAEIAMRVGYISAVANNDCEITPECITAAIAFAEWQERVRTSFQPGMARNQSAQCMEAILPVIAKITDWFRWRDLVLKKSWSKTWGTLVTQCKDNLVREGTLEAEYGTDDHGRTTSRPTGVVRYVPPTPRKGKSATPVAPLTPPSLR